MRLLRKSLVVITFADGYTETDTAEHWCYKWDLPFSVFHYRFRNGATDEDLLKPESFDILEEEEKKKLLNGWRWEYTGVKEVEKKPIQKKYYRSKGGQGENLRWVFVGNVC